MRHAPAMLTLLLLVGCGGAPPDRQPSPGAGDAASAAGAAAASRARTAPRGPLLVCLGDSLTAGLGLEQQQAWPALMERRLREQGYRVRVVNAGVSGDTTAGGLARLDWLLSQRPDLLLVGLGANDGLRGQPPAQIAERLREIIVQAQAAGARVLLLGMLIPPSYGQDYAREFAEIYPRLADELGVERLPFLLEGVAAVPELNLPDGMHPNAEGHRRIADSVTPVVAEMLEQLGAGAGASASDG